MNRTRIALPLVALAGTLVLFGCGGQNSTNNSFGGGSAGGYGAFGPNGQQNRNAQQANAEAAQSPPVFLSDSSGTAYDHVWAKVYEISIQTSTSSSIVFADPNGRIIDLKTLREKDGPRFAFMGTIDPKIGDLVRAQVTLDKDLSVSKADSKEATKIELTDATNAEGGKVKYTINLNPRLTKGENPSIVLDFDLKKLEADKEGKTELKMKVGDWSGADEKSNQIPMEYTGTLASVAGSVPALSFNLNFGDNRSQRMTTDSLSTIFSIDGVVNPTLSDGNLVDVRGIYRYPERQFIVQSIRVREAGSQRAPQEVIGDSAKFDAEKGTFEVAPRQLNGFAPATGSVLVSTTDKTLMLAANGSKATKEDVDKALAKPGAVEVEGEYDAATNTLKASWVKINGVAGAAKPNIEVKDPKDPKTTPDPKGAQPPVKGTVPENPIPGNVSKTPAVPDGTIEGSAVVSDFDPNAGSFTLSSVAGQGLNQKADSLGALVDDHTAFQDQTGSLVGKAQFYKQLTKGKKILFKGDLKDGMLILRRVAITK